MVVEWLALSKAPDLVLDQVRSFCEEVACPFCLFWFSLKNMYCILSITALKKTTAILVWLSWQMHLKNIWATNWFCFIRVNLLWQFVKKTDCMLLVANYTTLYVIPNTEEVIFLWWYAVFHSAVCQSVVPETCLLLLINVNTQDVWGVLWL